jgi:hypothetical protein
VNCDIDHLVVAAATLEQGTQWCEATLGVTPGPGGRHAFMATHNRLLALGGEAFARSYLEILAVDPDAPRPGRARWFGLDDPDLGDALQSAPRLVQIVVRTPAIERMRRELMALGIDPGTLVAAERQTASGPLAWRIALRDDGRFGADGALPPLIEWRGAHPTDAMPASALRLEAVTLYGLPLPVQRVLQLCGATLIEDRGAGDPLLRVRLATPRGSVTLESG